MIGSTISHYKILEKLGAGGMGVVYRAHDTKLDRDVALKFLPPDLTRDEEAKQRFIHEAQAASALQHNNICAVHDIDATPDGQIFIVMDCYDGESLRARIDRGHLRLEEVINLALQVARGLAKAHEKGIVHRDIKPANIFVTMDGTVRILDFGLAKLVGSKTRLTKAGTTLGTVGYMSPEQVQGLEVDHRTDIFSFGVILYELLVRRSPFKGAHEAAIIYEIINAEPERISSFRSDVSPELEAIVTDCMAKDPSERCQSAAEVARRLHQLKRGTGNMPVKDLSTSGRILRRENAKSPAFAQTTLNRVLRMIGLVVIGSSMLTFIVWKAWGPRPAPSPATRFSIVTPEGTQLSFPFSSSLAISPDGSAIVFAASSLQSGGGQFDPRQGGTGQLYLRRLDDYVVKPIPGTLGGFGPFFSPDGEWIAFVSEGKLKKVALQGGSPIPLCGAPNFRGGIWGLDGRIVFTPDGAGGLWCIASSGGTPQRLTTVDADRGEVSHRFPDMLPDEKEVLYTLKLNNISSFDDAKIVVERLDSKERRILVEGGTYARYVPTGHILYARGGSLYTIPFDEKRLEVTGPPVEVLVGGMMIQASGAAEFSFSSTGTLVYAPGGPYPLDLYTVKWVDRRGKVEPLIEVPGPYYQLALSPDGQRLAFSMLAANNDIWVYDISRNKTTRLSFAEGNRALPVWTPDGKRIVYRSEQTGVGNLYWKAADGSGGEEQLTTSDFGQDPSSWTPDGKILAFSEINQTGGDIWMLALQETSIAWPFLRTQFSERQGAFSPDGRWLAYTSNETGQDEVFVVPFPKAEGKWQVSFGGGFRPSWSRDGTELFYRKHNKMMSVGVTLHPSFRSVTPRELFELPPDVRDVSVVSPDNRKFAIVTGQQLATTQINVVLGWFEELNEQ